jgi:tight adherence protein B
MTANLNLVLMIGGGLGLALLIAGLVMSFIGRGSVVEERLGRYSESGSLARPAAEAIEERAKSPSALSDFINRLGEGTNLFENLSRNLARADLKFRPGEFIALMVILAILGGAIGTILGRSIVLGVVSLVIGMVLPHLYLLRAQGKRLKDFNNQLADMLSLMVNGLRAGYSTLMAMEAVGREMPPPIADEFRRVVQEIQLGISTEDALNHLVRRIDSDDLDLVITAIDVQREVGGNLAEVLDTISETIRERVRIKGEIQALTAMGRYTAWAISLMPIGLVLLLFLINRPYVMQFFNPETRACGLPLLILAGCMIVAGFFIVQRIVNIDI